jgi:hypothetical protein
MSENKVLSDMTLSHSKVTATIDAPFDRIDISIGRTARAES